ERWTRSSRRRLPRWTRSSRRRLPRWTRSIRRRWPRWTRSSRRRRTRSPHAKARWKPPQPRRCRGHLLPLACWGGGRRRHDEGARRDRLLHLPRGIRGESAAVFSDTAHCRRRGGGRRLRSVRERKACMHARASAACPSDRSS
uniref:Uncharacterized protein n=1 Tax=Aegilops tauschii subsp. strangulata TaxID=200361 RepID=A0A453B4W8_AEGTS